ncbi:hypothetical protein [Microbacterium sp. P04]|uniref:hypothetical protein n=1 Tax=Microbacterium sp. P04 TaxID=3366947 RepID=UPI00374507A3
MSVLADAAVLDQWTSALTAMTPGTLVTGVDVSCCDRPRAARSRLQQAMTRLAVSLYTGSASRAVVIVWSGDHAAGDRIRSLAVATAESLHRHSEMTRGCPLGVSVVFADAATPAEVLGARLCHGRLVTDGVAAVGWEDVCAHGVAEAAAVSRL